VSDTSSWVFKVTPYIVFSTSLVAAIFVPISTLIPKAGFTGDIIMIIYVLALGRFFTMLTGLDTGSTFGGMGSSREAMISSLIEPSMMLSFITIALIAKTTSVSGMMEYMARPDINIIQPVFLLIFLAMIIIIIAETSRIPMDDPETHLELTMVHEAMILEYSGRHLALMEFGAVIKQLLFITLLTNLFLPHDSLINFTGLGAIIISILIYVLKVVIISIVIGIIEINTVKLRLFSIPNFAAISFVLSFVGFLQYFVFGR
jgi:formate hydrogenlyase subunit 4